MADMCFVWLLLLIYEVMMMMMWLHHMFTVLFIFNTV